MALVLLSPFRSPGYLQILAADDSGENACFNQEVINALNAIREVDPELAAMVDMLEQSPIVHKIKQTRCMTWSDGDNPDHHQEIFFNPRENHKLSDGVCADPIAALVHELYHAFDNQNGTLQAHRAHMSYTENFIKESEYLATKQENVYRRAKGLCIRTAYGGVSLPSADIAGACPDQKNVTCTKPAGICPRCCCWIYGLTPTGEACIIDDLTLSECYSFRKPNVSPGCYSTPCDFPANKTCP